MKLLKNIFSFLGLLLIAGGGIVLAWQYIRNKALFQVLVSNSIVKGSLGVLQKMGYAIIAIVLGLILLVIAMKFGSIARRNEREKKALLKAQQKEIEENNRQLKLEAEKAQAEAEEARKEAQKLKDEYMSNQEEAKVEEKAID